MSEAAARRARRRVTVAVGLGQLLAWASSYYLLAILARPMAEALALPPVAVYGCFAATLLVGAALGAPAGRLIDRHGGRRVLLASNVLFALSLLVLAAAQGPLSLLLGWLLMGVAMPFGLYDAAFATLVGQYREHARRSIVGVTLLGGFASTVGWPLSAAVEAHYGWRAVCGVWAVLHLSVGVFLHYRYVPRGLPAPWLASPGETEAAPSAAPGRAQLWLLAAVFTASGFAFAAMAAHLPRLLELSGCTPAAAVAAASLVGASQVAARLAEAGWLSRLHPMVSARVSMILHPIGALLLALFGAPMAAVFTVLHGAGVGLMTIVKGTLPLTLFGPRGFGHRAGLLEAPSRVAQAAAPVLYGLCLDTLGADAVWITLGLVLAGFCGVLWIGRRTS